MVDLKRFSPDEVDETLTRVVTYGGETFLLFPYINAVRGAPQFNSISSVIKGPAATVADFTTLSDLVRREGEHGRWFISFNTPWLISPAEAEEITGRTTDRGKRER
jgi:hypothetical protein